MLRRAVLLFLIAGTAMAQAAPMTDFERDVLAAHNRERAAVGVPPLTWSDALAADAAPWAKHLAELGTLQHSRDDQRLNEGENLWMGTAGGYTPTQMVSGWAREKRYFRPGVFKNGLADDGQVIGHYTQMIWKTTTQVGCAMATGGGYDVLVCRYAPPGNWIGQAPY
ncbi:MAG TPA: CAP domain-containing protein [Rhizomicrobium sp.]|nr:CAP domain-containing protein [Rhizomicrobium sp.]